MALVNLSFEDGSPVDGMAESWSVASQASVYEIAEFHISENSATYSEDFESGPWTQAGGSINAGAIDGPSELGRKAMDFVEDGALGQHRPAFVMNVNPSGSRVTWSCYAKAGNRGWMLLQFNPGWYECYFDIANGTIGTCDIPVGFNPEYGMEDAGDGWWRCWISFDPPDPFGHFIGAADSDGGASYQGQSQSAIYITGAMLDYAGHLTEYQWTEASIVAKKRWYEGFDPGWDGNQEDQQTLADRDLLEALFDTVEVEGGLPYESFANWDAAYQTELSTTEQAIFIVDGSSNQLTYSEQFDNAAWLKTECTISADVEDAPPGFTGQIADALVDNGNDAQHRVSRTIIDLGAVPGTLSVYAKKGSADWLWMRCSSAYAWFNLDTGAAGATSGSPEATSMVDVGDGWYRCSITKTLAGSLDNFYLGSATADGDQDYAGTTAIAIVLFGAQLELASNVGFYRKTEAAIVAQYIDDEEGFELAWGYGVDWFMTLSATDDPDWYTENLFSHSDQFDNAAWLKTECSVSADSGWAPAAFGYSEKRADGLHDNANNTQHYLSRTIVDYDEEIIFSVYVLGAAVDYIWMRIVGQGEVYFDLANGVVGTVSVAPTDKGIEAIQGGAGGWYRCWVKAPAAASQVYELHAADDDTGDSAYVGAGTVALFLFGAQLERPAGPSGYLETGDAAISHQAETFFHGWTDDDYMSLRDPIDGSFDNAAEDYEDFEETRFAVQFTVTPATDKLNATGHPFSNGDELTLQSGGRLPGGLAKRYTYYVINKGANDFELSLSLGGSAVDITDPGWGVHEALADMSDYWVTELE